MATVLIRRLDEEIVKRLERRAAVNNRSLESELRHILEQAAEGDFAAKQQNFQQLSRAMRKQTSGRAHTPSHILVREDRESDHEAF